MVTAIVDDYFVEHISIDGKKIREEMMKTGSELLWRQDILDTSFKNTGEVMIPSSTVSVFLNVPFF